MVVTNGLLRIFWPSDALKIKSQGVLIGWRNSSLDIFVACVLHDVEVRPSVAPARASVLMWARHEGSRVLCG